MMRIEFSGNFQDFKASEEQDCHRKGEEREGTR
jgi:hypothetical protein